MVSQRKYVSLGLIGYPLDKSLSPTLHTAGLRALGLEGEYRLYRTPRLPEGQAVLPVLIDRVRAGSIQGLNVTIPHKCSVISLLDELSEVAHSVGAVNTIYPRDGRVIGDNTDAAGFLIDMARQTEFTRPGVGFVLGAGGAARAVVYALWSSGWQVFVASRRPEQAQDLAESLQASGTSANLPMKALSAISISSDLPRFLQRTSSGPSEPLLIVNASSAGMLPNIDDSPLPEGADLPPGAFVYDLVYKPLETRLMRVARQSGLRVANGLGMLVEQAALALERWTGYDVPRLVMWQALKEAGMIREFPDSILDISSNDPDMRNEFV